MDSAMLIVGLGLIAGSAIAASVLWAQSRRTLGTAAKRRLLRQWQHVRQADSPTIRVLEADKVIDRLLTELGYEGSFGAKLKQAGPRIKNEQSLWDAHKLRNRLAHESGLSVTQKEADRAVESFKKTLRQFL